MKAIINKEKKEESEFTFPVLMRSKNLNQIVLFFEGSHGMIIDKGNSDLLNYHIATNWASCYDDKIWEPFTGSVTISND